MLESQGRLSRASDYDELSSYTELLTGFLFLLFAAAERGCRTAPIYFEF